MEGERWHQCQKCDFAVNQMFSKKFCFEHLAEELVEQLPEGFQPGHIKLVLNAVMNHYHPMKHKPRLDEHVRKEWNGNDLEQDAE
jgi:hypothetical protein